jgi:hypothetical protein
MASGICFFALDATLVLNHLLSVVAMYNISVMLINKPKDLTPFQRAFLEPSSPTHRQYEALRAFFVDDVSSAEAARRFGYTPGSFRILCHQFRQNPQRPFFLSPRKGPQVAPKRDPVRSQAITLRKQNLSIYDIQRSLADKGSRLSAVSISKILKEEGFARLPRRGDDERPQTPAVEKADTADAKALDLTPRTLKTKFGGLFLFMRYLAKMPLERICDSAGLPGTSMVPAAHAVRALLALKLFGSARYSHVMGYVFDEGLALFSGLNSTPKRSFLTEYSSRVDPRAYPVLTKKWFDATDKMGLGRGTSFDLDFHTIPFHGDDSLVEKHYISKRSQRQKGILAFLAHDAQKHVFCYVNAALSKATQNDEVLRFIEYWRERTGHQPEELIFDSKLTTYANLNALNTMGIDFVTIRRRTDKILDEVFTNPSSAWRRIELSNVARQYRNPRVLDTRIRLPGYDKDIRQIAVRDLGHEEPTLLLTNQLSRSASALLDRYARRMVIENAIADGIDFFHVDALTSAVALKVDFDLQLTLMASTLYRMLGVDVGVPYDTAKSRRIFRDFVDATAQISIDDRDITVLFQKRAHNPLLKAAGFEDAPVAVPWLGGKRLRIVLG